MRSKNVQRHAYGRGHTARQIVAASLLSLIAAPSLAFQFDHKGWSGSLDNTVSYGFTSRTENPDQRLIGIANGGSAFSVNGDDANLNYNNKGIISSTVKITSELELNYQDSWGVFVRGTAFHDFKNANGDTDRIDLTDDAVDLVGRRGEILDAYLWSAFDLGGRPAEIRLGDQVLSWGESTFIGNSINTINPIDVAAIRTPGAELREALLPVTMFSASLGTSQNTSLEVFYQLDWEPFRIDPSGSYFSTNDFASDGGNFLVLGFGQAPDYVEVPLPTGGTTYLPNPALQAAVPALAGTAVPRLPDREADDSGQHGIAFRVFAPNLNDTEFGFYYMNYHSRLPIINGHSGTLPGLLSGNFAGSGGYFVSYPEDIELFGASFNTTVGDTAVQGEISHRQDVPLQVDDVELLFATLGGGGDFSAALAGLRAFNQVGAFGLDEDVPGFRRLDVTQVQATATHTVPQFLGADQAVFVGEAGVTYVHDLPDKDLLRFEGPGTYASGNPILAPGQTGLAAGVVESSDHFPDSSSWGYRLLARLQYNNAIGAWNLLPRIAWQHDVSGITPGPGGPFLEGRRALTVGLGGSYQKKWQTDVSYTSFSGAGRYNLINDRDFFAASVKFFF